MNTKRIIIEMDGHVLTDSEYKEILKKLWIDLTTHEMWCMNGLASLELWEHGRTGGGSISISNQTNTIMKHEGDDSFLDDIVQLELKYCLTFCRIVGVQISGKNEYEEGEFQKTVQYEKRFTSYAEAKLFYKLMKNYVRQRIKNYFINYDRGHKHKIWAAMVKERDGKCMECGSVNALCAHHKISFAENKELRYNVSNGITLCKKCHAKKHGVVA